MKTRSQQQVISAATARTASRKSLLVRFRTTAPPILLLTEKPNLLQLNALGRAWRTISGWTHARPSVRTFRKSAFRRRRVPFLFIIPGCHKKQGPHWAPAHTVSRFRPRRCRARMTLRPFFVRIRARKPCTFSRRRFLGCQVRFGMKYPPMTSLDNYRSHSTSFTAFLSNRLSNLP